jgi:hypothetical protein
VYQAQSPEFKPQYHKIKGRERERDRERDRKKERKNTGETLIPDIRKTSLSNELGGSTKAT